MCLCFIISLLCVTPPELMHRLRKSYLIESNHGVIQTSDQHEDTIAMSLYFSLALLGMAMWESQSSSFHVCHVDSVSVYIMLGHRGVYIMLRYSESVLHLLISTFTYLLLLCWVLWSSGVPLLEEGWFSQSWAHKVVQWLGERLEKFFH